MIGTSSIVANDWAAASSVRLNPSDQATASYRLWWCCLKLISLLDWSKKASKKHNLSLTQPTKSGRRSINRSCCGVHSSIIEEEEEEERGGGAGHDARACARRRCSGPSNGMCPAAGEASVVQAARRTARDGWCMWGRWRSGNHLWDRARGAPCPPGLLGEPNLCFSKRPTGSPQRFLGGICRGGFLSLAANGS